MVTWITYFAKWGMFCSRFWDSINDDYTKVINVVFFLLNGECYVWTKISSLLLEVEFDIKIW